VTTVQRSGWSFGTAESASATMKKMAKRVRGCLQSREVIENANRIIAPVRSRDKRAQIHAIDTWLSRRFRFVADPIGVELLRDPAEAIRSAVKNGYTQGDCDEAAMLAASLGMANGIPARFRALSFTPNGPYTHVIADLFAGGEWVPLDITKPQGMIVPAPTRTLTLAV